MIINVNYMVKVLISYRISTYDKAVKIIVFVINVCTSYAVIINTENKVYNKNFN